MTESHPQEMRIEHDSMGEVQVPKDALWRAQTQRAVENFPISGTRLEPDHVQALALVKAAAARVNARLGVLDESLAEAIGIDWALLTVGDADETAGCRVFNWPTATQTSAAASSRPKKPMVSASSVRGRRISRTITCATSLPPPNSASVTAMGESRTGPMPSEISASNPTSAASAAVAPILRAASSLVRVTASTLIGRPKAGLPAAVQAGAQQC